MSGSTTRVALTPTVRVGDAALDAAYTDALLRVVVRRSVHDVGSASLTFEDPWLDLFDRTDLAVGKDLEIKIPDADDRMQTVFTGTITALGLEAGDDDDGVGIATLVVEARDGSHVLAAASTFEAYLSGVADVVSKIANRHGLTAHVEGTPPTSEYILQTGTDHAMLTELARRCGYEWFADGSDLHFRPRPNTAGPTLSRADGTLLRFSVRYTGVGTPSTLDVHGWDGLSATAHTGSGSAALSGGQQDLGSNATFVSDQYANAKRVFGKDLAVGDPASRDATEARAVAEGLARELVGAGLYAEGVAPSNPAIRAGQFVTISSMGSKLNGDYYVSEVTHEFGPGREVRTRFTCGGHHPQPAPWTPDGAGGTWAGRGPVVGIVSNINDPENLGRVKVKFPSLNDTESDWARVVTPGAGAGRGLDFRPELNDEVLVAFERGDARFPLVLGGLWNSANKLARTDHVADGVVNSRLITSRLGHSIELGDGEGADSHVTVTLANGTSLMLSEQDGVVLDVAAGDLELKTSGGSIKLTEQGDLTIDVQGAVTVKAIKAVKVDGKATVELKGVQGAKVDGGLNFEAKGTQAKVEAQAMLTLKGGMVKIN